MSSNVNNDTESPKYTRNMVEWRRSIVLQKLSQGWTQQEIANYLKVSQPTISLDTQFLKCQAQQEMEYNISETIPFHYKLVMQGYMDNIRRANHIIENNPDDRTKIQAMTMLSNIFEKIMELDIHGPTIAAAVDKVKTLESSRWMLKEMEQSSSSLSLEDKEEAEEEDPEE
jgi:hypothetical protein